MPLGDPYMDTDAEGHDVDLQKGLLNMFASVTENAGSPKATHDSLASDGFDSNTEGPSDLEQDVAEVSNTHSVDPVTHDRVSSLGGLVGSFQKRVESTAVPESIVAPLGSERSQHRDADGAGFRPVGATACDGDELNCSVRGASPNYSPFDFPLDGMAPAVQTIVLSDSDHGGSCSPVMAPRAHKLRYLLNSGLCEELAVPYPTLVALLTERSDGAAERAAPRKAIAFNLKFGGPIGKIQAVARQPKKASEPPLTLQAISSDVQASSPRVSDSCHVTLSETQAIMAPRAPDACANTALGLLRRYARERRWMGVSQGQVVFDDDSVEYPCGTLLPLRSPDGCQLNLVSLWLLAAFRERYTICTQQLCDKYGAVHLPPGWRRDQLLDFIVGQVESCELLIDQAGLDNPTCLPKRLLRHRENQVSRALLRRAHATEALHRLGAEQEGLQKLTDRLSAQLNEVDREIEDAQRRSLAAEVEYQEELGDARDFKRRRHEATAKDHDFTLKQMFDRRFLTTPSG